MKSQAVKVLKAERRMVVKELKKIDSVLAKLTGGVVRRKRRAKGKKAAAPKAPRKKVNRVPKTKPMPAAEVNLEAKRAAARAARMSQEEE